MFSVIFEAENWTIEEINGKLPHVKYGGDHSPTFCRPRYAGWLHTRVQRIRLFYKMNDTEPLIGAKFKS